MYHYFFGIVFLSLWVPSSLQCMPGFETPGYTYPRGNIHIEAGKNLEIYCVIDLKKASYWIPGLNASNVVYFMTHRAPLDVEHTIEIVNITTAKLTIRDIAPVQDKYYFCHLQINETNTVPVCVNKVSAGYAPGNDLDFSCVSNNWESLTCTWKAQHNYVHTDYKLYYTIISTKKLGHTTPYRCPKIEENKSGIYSCTWTSNSYPLYRLAPSKLLFHIEISNALGQRNITREFKHFENVIPAKPVITQVITYNHGVFLEWSAHKNLIVFPGSLANRVKYKSEFDITQDDDVFEDDWMAGDESKIVKLPDSVIFQLNITDLKYAYALYDVRIRLKSGVAPNESDKWSKYESRSFRTTPKLPERPPKTNIGSFEIQHTGDSRNVIIYWEQIKEHEKNGPSFSYQVINITENGEQRTLSPVETTNSYVKYNDLSYNSYNFTIVSTNEVGQSIDHSLVFVPSSSDVVHEPILFIKTILDDATYELSWNPSTDNITSYTIFWCQDYKDRPYQCKGDIHWVEVPGSSTAHTITLPVSEKTYQFAISENTKTVSSGMVWASCIVLNGQSKACRTLQADLATVNSDVSSATRALIYIY